MREQEPLSHFWHLQINWCLTRSLSYYLKSNIKNTFRIIFLKKANYAIVLGFSSNNKFHHQGPFALKVTADLQFKNCRDKFYLRTGPNKVICKLTTRPKASISGKVEIKTINKMCNMFFCIISL